MACVNEQIELAHGQGGSRMAHGLSARFGPTGIHQRDQHGGHGSQHKSPPSACGGWQNGWRPGGRCGVMRCGGWCWGTGEDCTGFGRAPGQEARARHCCCYIRCALPACVDGAARPAVVPAVVPPCPPSPRSRFGLYLDLIRWDRPAGWLVPVAHAQRAVDCGRAFRAGTCSSCLCWAPSSCAARAAA